MNGWKSGGLEYLFQHHMHASCWNFLDSVKIWSEIIVIWQPRIIILFTDAPLSQSPMRKLQREKPLRWANFKLSLR